VGTPKARATLLDILVVAVSTAVKIPSLLIG